MGRMHVLPEDQGNLLKTIQKHCDAEEWHRLAVS